MNKVVLSGRIASELELKTTSSASVCSFRLAVSRRFKNAEGKYDTDFISCVAWRSNADFISKYFKKGEPIEIVGSLQARSYENDGHKVYVTEVVIDEASFVLSNNKADGQNKVASTETSSTEGFGDGFIPMSSEDDLPF